MVAGTKEKDALGGNVKEQMRNELQPEIRYLGTFSWTSFFSHGSVLALREIAKAIGGKAEDFLFEAFDYNQADALLYYASWVLDVCFVQIEQKFGIEIRGLDELVVRASVANQRLNIVTPEKEARYWNYAQKRGEK